MPRCASTRGDGQPCMRFASTGSIYCPNHQPAAPNSGEWESDFSDPEVPLPNLILIIFVYLAWRDDNWNKHMKGVTREQYNRYCMDKLKAAEIARIERGVLIHKLDEAMNKKDEDFKLAPQHEVEKEYLSILETIKECDKRIQEVKDEQERLSGQFILTWQAIFWMLILANVVHLYGDDEGSAVLQGGAMGLLLFKGFYKILTTFT